MLGESRNDYKTTQSDVLAEKISDLLSVIDGCRYSREDVRALFKESAGQYIATDASLKANTIIWGDPRYLQVKEEPEIVFKLVMRRLAKVDIDG